MLAVTLDGIRFGSGDAAEQDWDFLLTAVANWPGGPRSDPANWAERPAGLRGSNNDLGEVLSRRVPTGRMVVLGEPGAGKTMLLVRLVPDLLERRDPGGPVPVLVPLASWNPREQSLHGWLGSRLAMDYSGLREPFAAGGGNVNRVQALLDRRLLVPVMDGLDEMPQAARGLAIGRINEAMRPGERLVVSSHLAEYREAVLPAAGPSAMLRDTAGITLHDVDPAAVRAYLRRDAGSSAAARWEPVFALLGTTAPVAEAPRTPLMVSLARTIYNPRLGEHVGSLPDPVDLCDTARLASASDVRRHLFDAFIPAAYRSHPHGGVGRRWRAADARRWLVFLARHLEHRLDGTTDLEWWELRSSAPRWVLGLVVGSLCGMGSGYAAEAGSRIGMGFGLGLGSGIILALAVGLPIRRRGASASGPGIGLAGGLAGGMLGGLAAGMASMLGVGSAPGPAGGLSAGLGVGVGAGPASGLLGGLVGSLAGGLLAGLITGLGIGLPAGIVNGLGVGLGAGLTVALATSPQPAQRLRWSSVGLIGGLAAGLALALTAWAVAGPTVGLPSGSGWGWSVRWSAGSSGHPLIWRRPAGRARYWPGTGAPSSCWGSAPVPRRGSSPRWWSGSPRRWRRTVRRPSTPCWSTGSAPVSPSGWPAGSCWRSCRPRGERSPWRGAGWRYAAGCRGGWSNSSPTPTNTAVCRARSVPSTSSGTPNSSAGWPSAPSPRGRTPPPPAGR
jgi:hypothetical protein